MRRRVCFVALALIVCASLALADAPRTGLVSGTVTDPEGQPLAGARVHLDSERGRVSTVSDGDGNFRFVFVIPDTYTLEAELTGYQSAAGAILVNAGGRSHVDLELGEVAGEEIVVTAETPMVSRYDVTAGGSVASEEIALVPVEGRNYTQVLNMMPSVSNNAQSQRYYGFQPEVEGTGAGRTTYYIDGVDVSFSRYGGASRLQFPSFALQEVKLEASGMDAQYSRVVGGVSTMTMRSGSNKFHGGFSYYGQNLAWNDQYDITPVPLTDELKNSFEVMLSGPLVRDKLWFMVAYGDRSDPGQEILSTGEIAVDTGMSYTAPVIKLDWRPSMNHSVTGAWVETPIELNWFNNAVGEEAAMQVQSLAANLFHAGWNWAISDSLLLDTHIAIQGSEQTRTPYILNEIDSACSEWQPCGNHLVYRDMQSAGRWRYNGPSMALGVGEVNWPRDQFNVSLDWFAGVHSVKFGIDYQKLGWESSGGATPEIQGGFYNRYAPGGFEGNMSQNPAQWGVLRVYLTPGDDAVAQNTSDVTAFFVRDQISLKRWTFNLGVRVDKQAQETDGGTTTVDSTDFAPRLAAVYDLKGDSSLLASATVGRYWNVVPMQWTAQFNEEVPTGSRTYFNAFGWDPTTQGYTRALGGVLPGDVDVTQINPYYKDEATLGLDWSINQRWALKTKLVFWRMHDFFTNNLQFTSPTSVARIQRNEEDYESERQALHLQLQRRFANNWTFAASYVYSQTEGNCQVQGENGTVCAQDWGELVDIQIDPDTGNAGPGVSGIPVSLYNRYGPMNQDHPHVFKIRGTYLFNLGRGHSFNLGGSFWLSSGTAWESWTQLRYPLPGVGNTNVILFNEPRGSQRTPTQRQLNLALDWNFPIAGGLTGKVRAEANNALNSQTLIGTVGLSQTGAPAGSSLNYQRPRYYKLMLGLQF